MTSHGPIVGRRVAVAISGGGRTLANLLAVQKNFDYEIAAVIASRPDCKGVDIARAHNLPIFIDNFGAKAASDLGERLYQWLDEQRINWVALGGFLKRFPLSSAWDQRIVNIHPALLPRYGGHGMYGQHVHEAVINAQEKQSGATVHFVNAVYDDGAIIAQITTTVRPEDNADTLAARVFAAECQLYPQVLHKLVTKKLPLPSGQIERLSHDHTL